MVKVRLEKRPSLDPYGVWWLEINGMVPSEKFPLASAIENNLILERVIATQSDRLVIDFSTIREFDSRGLQLLLMLYKQFAPQNIQIVLRNPSPYLSRVLRIMQFDRVFEVELVESSVSSEEGSEQR